MVTLFQTIIYILYKAEDKMLFQDIQQNPELIPMKGTLANGQVWGMASES